VKEKADAVHKLAGSAAVLGALELGSLLRQLEDEYRRGEDAAPAAALEGLPRAWEATRAQIRACRATPLHA
jgi:HPt (histidine-containing phosphotransfer) domain-containing protein